MTDTETQAPTVQEALAAWLPKDAIDWRAGSISTKNDPANAMALAYMDGRAVMDRLDEVVGVDAWQDKYEDTKDGVRCGIGIFFGDEWIWKWDAAPYTDFEAVKGGHSDALKRAAVKWGIGRYLYAFPAPWVPCEIYMKGDKPVFKYWKASPWAYAIEKGLVVPAGYLDDSPTPKPAPAEKGAETTAHGMNFKGVGELRVFYTKLGQEKWDDILEAQYPGLPESKYTQKQKTELLDWFHAEMTTRKIFKANVEKAKAVIQYHWDDKEYRALSASQMNLLGRLLQAHQQVDEAVKSIKGYDALVKGWERNHEGPLTIAELADLEELLSARNGMTEK